MSNPLEVKSFDYIVDLRNLNVHMSRLISRFYTSGIHYLQRKNLPSLIYIRPKRKMMDEESAVFSVFLKKLRDIHDDYFIRFAVSIDTAVESDTTDIFYIRDTLFSYHKDAIFTVDVLSEYLIEIKVTIPFSSLQHKLLNEVSQCLFGVIDISDTDITDEFIIKTMTNFYITNNLSDIFSGVIDNLHIAFLLSPNKDKLFTVPIWGLTNGDAFRKFTAHEEALDIYSSKYASTLKFIPDHDTTFINVLEECVETLDIEDVKRAYGLLEILFGYYMEKKQINDLSVDKNDIFSIIPIKTEDSITIDIHGIKNISIL